MDNLLLFILFFLSAFKVLASDCQNLKQEAIKSEDYDLLTKYGLSCIHQGEYLHGANALERAEKLDQNRIEAFLGQGLHGLKTENYEKAYKFFSICLEFLGHPEYDLILYYHGVSAQKLGYLRRAKSSLQKVVWSLKASEELKQNSLLLLKLIEEEKTFFAKLGTELYVDEFGYLRHLYELEYLVFKEPLIKLSIKAKGYQKAIASSHSFEENLKFKLHPKVHAIHFLGAGLRQSTELMTTHIIHGLGISYNDSLFNDFLTYEFLIRANFEKGYNPYSYDDNVLTLSLKPTLKKEGKRWMVEGILEYKRSELTIDQLFLSLKPYYFLLPYFSVHAYGEFYNPDETKFGLGFTVFM